MTDPLIDIYDETYPRRKQDLRSMDWANRYSLDGLTFYYNTLEMFWGVIEKKVDYVKTFRKFLFVED